MAKSFLLARGAATLALATLLASPAFASPPAGATAQLSAELSVSVTDDGRIFATLTGAPLQLVLKVIGKKANLEIDVQGSLSDLVTAEFSSVPLDQAVRTLLRDRNYALFYGRQNGTTRLTGVWVLDKAERSSSQATPDLQAIVALTHAQDPTVRDLALLKLGTSREREATAVLVERLGDPDPDVRRTVVGALSQSPYPAAVDALATTLVSDGHADVRQVAAATLASRGGPLAAHALEIALHDDVPYIREFARLFLEQLKSQ